ncbi:MAG TPA: pyridoxamine 5'-phosphate oxidase family protein [Ignavibacteria bacterium]|nr:pyridoxamine 5'-phosphate oxidase family protein [Ignavibacteria bacterium]HMR40777.1 pyridoxamine 5'-phosphate oxidase family protein [Ignavibacteria bacterium]
MDNNKKIEIVTKIKEIFKSNDAISIATTGGELSPWILNAYFASDELKIYLFIDTDGKSMVNMKINNRIAIAISKNDAMQDFLQGYGTIEILKDTEESFVRDLLTKKMPWFKTYTPVTPVRIDIEKFYVSSFESKWFPARELEIGD